MKLLFISNFINHHQSPICNEFYKLLGDNFKFVACEKIPKDKISLGYKKEFDLPYLIDGTKSDNVYKYLKDADVLIAGSCPHEYMEYFIDNKKLIFIYTERIFKDGTWHKYSPIARFNMYRYYNRKFNENMYLLCSSAYTASDYNDFNAFKNHYLKWGYFPELSKFNYSELSKKKVENSIIWVGRLIDWKHPEQAVYLADYLRNKNINFKLTMIGDGPLKNKLEKMIEHLNLSDFISLSGSMPFMDVRRKMETSDIFIFTSDFNEGWGAVLNEAMASACACVAGYKAGSSIFLIDNNNGTIYDNTQNDLNNKVLTYIKNITIKNNHMKNAFETVNNIWNYKNAAANFINVAEKLLDKKILQLPIEGPLSKAEIINNKKGKNFVSAN